MSRLYKDQPQIEKREDKEELFSNKVSNEYSVWSFPDCLIVVSIFDINKFEEKGPNFLYAMESTDVSTINQVREEAKKKSKIEIQPKLANVDFSKLFLPKEAPIVKSLQKPIGPSELTLKAKKNKLKMHLYLLKKLNPQTQI